MASVRQLSVDPSGIWSERQTRAVMDIINPEARQMNIRFAPTDVTSQNMRERRFMLVAYCMRHEIPVEKDSVCDYCLHESRALEANQRAKLPLPRRAYVREDHVIRLLLLRIIVVLGYLPHLFLQWLAGGPHWLEDHHVTATRMWRGKRE